MVTLFKKTTLLSLILVYLVIIAGAAVRMTGSGMGCPDWPKCFGYYIPPTERATLEWSPNRFFEKGQVIIVDDKLWVAKEDFKSSNNFSLDDFAPFTKHDYAEFNATKTWIEYINRLIGALAGLVCLVAAFLSFSYLKINKFTTLLSWIVVFCMAFQAWLGATVVFSVLNPIRITLHMVMALVIVMLIFYILKSTSKATMINNKQIKTGIIITLILSFIQIILGTQVRQLVDEVIKSGITNERLWLKDANIWFYVHRSLSILVFLSNFWLWRLFKKNYPTYRLFNWVIVLIGLEIASGIIMYYFHFPFSTQALHLVLASLLFGIQWYIFLDVVKKPYLEKV